MSHDATNWAIQRRGLKPTTKIVLWHLCEISQAGIKPLGIPTWSPDGLRLAFQASANGDMEIFQVLILNSEFTQITVDSGVDGKPVWTAN